MKKMIILSIVALSGFSVQAADRTETIKAATFSTAVTNVVTFTAAVGRVTQPVLFVHTTTQTNTPVITVNPAKAGAPNYTVYTGTAKTNETTTVVVNDLYTTASPKIVLLPGDVLTVTGTAASWGTAGYYMIIKETVQ